MIAWMISSTVLILTVLALRQALKEKISARLRYALWGLVLVRLLVPWNLGSAQFSVMQPLEQTDLVRQAEAIQNIASISHTPAGAVEGYRPNEAPTTLIPQATPAEFERMETMLTLRDLLVPLWLLGMAVLTTVFLGSNLTFRRRLSKTRKPLDRADSLLPVYVSDCVESPCLFGLFQPAIYLPPAVSTREPVIRHALAHELTHYRQGDHVWAHLRCLCLVLHWYNPLVWLAALVSRRDSELACDEGTLVLLGETERVAYGKTLLELTCANHAGLLHTATTMTGGKRSLRERISRIASQPRRLWQATLAVALAASLLVACTFTGPQETTTPETAEHNCTNVDITERMAALKAEDIFWESYKVQYPLVVPALNDAAEHPVPTPEESRHHYSMKLYLNDDCTTELSHFLLYACLEENVVRVRYQNPIGELQERHFESEELYRIIQNYGQRTIVMYQRDYERFRAEIDGAATKILNEHGFTDFDVKQFQAVDQFDGYTVYEWDAVFCAAEGSSIPLSGEMYLDHVGRVRGAIEEPYFVVSEDGETRFFHRDLYAQEQDDVENAIRQAFAQEPIIGTEPPATVPGLSGTPLTAEEIAQVNAAFAPFVYDDAGAPVAINPASCFFTSYYETVDELNFEEFLRYFPDHEFGVSDQEFEALKAAGAEECDYDSKQEMPTPILRYPRATVDALLQKYAGITTADLDTSQVDYLEDYDAFYNYTSDLGPGSFHCLAGALDGDTVQLVSPHSILTLEKSGDTYLIRSLLPIE